MKDYRINYQLPASPLGPAVGEKQPKEECPFLSFERGDWINGAAPAPRNESQRDDQREQGAAKGVMTADAAPPFKVGDRVRVVRTDACQSKDMRGQVVTIDWIDSNDTSLPIRAAGFWWGMGEIELVQEKEEDPLLRAFKEDGIVRELRVGDRVRFKRSALSPSNRNLLGQTFVLSRKHPVYEDGWQFESGGWDLASRLEHV